MDNLSAQCWLRGGTQPATVVEVHDATVEDVEMETEDSVVSETITGLCIEMQRHSIT